MISRDRDPEARSRYRAFVRAHHPDAGGDPEVFAAGLEHFRARARPSDDRPDRYDGPVEVVPDAGSVSGLVKRVRAWRRRRSRSRVR
ncbi:hypothetical protein [Saccharopolyspora tripterygii]